MLFSIVVPVYNVEKYIDRCVTSLINQTYKDIEILLIDDGSTDSSPELCDKYASSDNRIKVIHKTNGGLSDARNKGLEIASGEYVMFIDSDDYIELDACAKFAEFAKMGVDTLVGDAIVEGGVCSLINPKPLEGQVLSGYEYFKRAICYAEVPVVAVCYVHRREFLLENDLRFKFGILHEDEHFTPRMLLKSHGVCYTGIKFYHYVLRDGSITKNKDKRKNAHDLLETFDELEVLFRQIKDKKFKKRLLNSLAEKYFAMFLIAKLDRYGKTYIRKKFALRNAKKIKTIIKAWIFTICPKIYAKLRAVE